MGQATGGQQQQADRRPRFKIAKGTRVLVRRAGEQQWTEYVTSRWLAFDRYEVADVGGRWLFARDGWELKLPPSSVQRRPGKAQKGKAKGGQRSRAPSRCRDCGHEERVHRYLFFKAARPRCSRCGGSLDYTGGWQRTR